ncbi:MAG TPA: pyrroline-5-carboxylate reductase dimerization domain-containing protein [Terriglobales bacterium]|nr:pyrroline-5-carboxylate reductase dimerization domain-containing protein [Terriglobales bacterium]
MRTTVFLGGGRITAALLAGLRRSKYRGPLLVHDHHLENLRQIRRLYGASTERDLHRAVEKAGILVIAVRPSSVSGLLCEIGQIGHPVIAVSLAAGIQLASLRNALGPRVRWARAMPSPACRSGHGLTALVFDRGFPAAGKREVKALFARVGPVLEIPERKFDAFTVTYSCSHGYHALATLANQAEKLGLDRRTALTAAAHALADGIVAWREGSIRLEALLREAATPGGIASATQEAARRAGYPRAVAAGLAAGMKQSRKNAKLA